MNLRCRDLDLVPSPYRKNGQLLKVNRHATKCHACGDSLQPGEAIIGGRDDGDQLRWICGAGRWTRP